MLRQYGDRRLGEWRGSYEVPPPPLDAEAWGTYWYDAIVPDLRAGGCVLVVSHGSTLRALVKHPESIPDEQIAELDIPTGIPLACRLGPDLRPDAPAGEYLDPDAAWAAVEAIRNQGRDAAEIRPRVAEGRAALVLVDAAEGAELLVVGSRGTRASPGAARLGRPVLRAPRVLPGRHHARQVLNRRSLAVTETRPRRPAAGGCSGFAITVLAMQLKCLHGYH